MSLKFGSIDAIIFDTVLVQGYKSKFIPFTIKAIFLAKLAGRFGSVQVRSCPGFVQTTS